MHAGTDGCGGHASERRRDRGVNAVELAISTGGEDLAISKHRRPHLLGTAGEWETGCVVGSGGAVGVYDAMSMFTVVAEEHLPAAVIEVQIRADVAGSGKDYF